MPDPAAAAEEEGRARLHGLLARLLAEPPDVTTLAVLGDLRPGPTPLETALGELGAAARATTGEAVAREYHDLFIGVGRGELVPYASHYLAGALNERPLAALRDALGRLGIARIAGRSEPEDHAASVLDVMAGLIDGRLASAGLEAQRGFFRHHVDTWMARFFTDLARAERASFYRPVAALGTLVLAIEREAFALQSSAASEGG